MAHHDNPSNEDSDMERSGISESSDSLPSSDVSPNSSASDDQKPIKRRRRRRSGKKLIKPEDDRREVFTPEHRLLLLDTWKRSGLPAGDFSLLCGVSSQTLYAWRRRFETQGPEGLMDKPKGIPRGSKLSEVTKRTIVMLKEAHPEWGCQRISDMLARGPGLAASPSSVSKVLHEAGYEFKEVTRTIHAQEPKRFERASPNQLWQTDLFTFVLKRQNRKVYLVAFMDDHSRFIVGHALHATQSSPLVIESLRASIASYQAPQEILTDNGSQYITWRGKSAFTKELDKRGIKQIVATPRRPQTLGKIERFWGSLWQECIETATFIDMEDARKRIALYIDYYNFQRPHQGIKGLVPADRFFCAAPEVLTTLKKRVEKKALNLAQNGLPKAPFYLTGNAGGKPFSVHSEGDRVILKHGEDDRKEVDLLPPQYTEIEFDTEFADSKVVAFPRCV